MTCKICHPANAQWHNRIKDLFLKGIPQYQILQILASEGFKVAPLTLRNHLRHTGLLRSSVEVIEPEKEIDVIGEIESNYRLLQEMTKRAINANWADPKALQAAREILSEARASLETLTKLRKEVSHQRVYTRENVIKMVIKLLEDIPDDSLQKLVNKLEAELASENT